MNKTTNKPTFQGLPILTTKDLSCQQDILHRTKQLFDFSLSRYSRVMFIRFDLTFGQNYFPSHDNKLLSKFIHNYSRYFIRNNIFHTYLWAKEQANNNINHHYHFIFLIESSQFMSCYQFLDKAEEIWAGVLGVASAKGLVERCVKDRNGNPQRNGIRIDRSNGYNSPELEQCFKWASYLSKVNTKQPVHGVRNWGSSNLT